MQLNRTDEALPWRLEDIELSKVNVERVRRRDALFLLVCSASFLESASDTYSSNLVNHFADDAQVGTWLREHWEPEEMQHGRALKAYLHRVWPEFDWDSAYAEFFAEFSSLCTVEKLEPTRGQEMVARCIVEMGTTTYYQALHAICDEPVLRDLAWRIRADEVRHYKHFHAHFLRYRQQERLRWPQVLASLLRRVIALRKSDASIALRHAASARFHGRISPESIGGLVQQVFGAMNAHYPVDLAVRMGLKPLQMRPGLQRVVERPLAAVARSVLLR